MVDIGTMFAEKNYKVSLLHVYDCLKIIPKADILLESGCDSDTAKWDAVRKLLSIDP